jgi:hypothetical protein
MEQELRKHLGLPNPNGGTSEANGSGKAEAAHKPNGDAHKVAPEAAKTAAKAATAGSSRASR